MDLYRIDYVAVSGRSPLHRAPAWGKLLGLALVIAVGLAVPSWPLHAALFGALAGLALAARVPPGLFFGLTGYPLVFLALLGLSLEGLTVWAAVAMAARVLALTAAVVLCILTTSFPALFSLLGRVVPGPLAAAFFFTYRALFILAICLIHARTALHLRGGMHWRRPLRSLTNLGRVLAHVLVHAIEMSQRVADNLIVRGYADRIYDLGRKS